MQQDEHNRQRFAQDAGELPVSQYLSRLTRRHPLLPHWHDRMEVFYVTQGEGLMKVELEQQPIAPGDVVVVAPGQLHSLTAAGEGGCTCRVVVFDLSMLAGQPMDRVARRYVHPLQSEARACVPVIAGTQALAASLRRCVDRVMEELAGGAAGWELMVKAGLLELLALLWRGGALTTRPAPGSQESQSVRQVLRYIDGHWNENLSGEVLSGVAGYSLYHFQRMFRRYVGDSPAAYIRQLRLRRAAQALLRENWSVSEVCLYAGFHTVSYFIECFQQQYGMTPRAYRSAGGEQGAGSLRRDGGDHGLSVGN